LTEDARDPTESRATIFLSHNRADSPFARSLGAQLKLAGADVWFDEWEIRAGDSLPAKINEGMGAFDVFVLVWSENSSRSDWVRRELEAAITLAINDPAVRVVPIRLDDTPLPPLLVSLRYLRGDEVVGGKLVIEILGLSGQRAWLMAVQQTLEEAGMDIAHYPGYGAIVGCPRCGSGLDAIEGWHTTDYERDDEYGGARCTACGWEDGGEL
jgi:hypothetical protein